MVTALETTTKLGPTSKSSTDAVTVGVNDQPPKFWLGGGHRRCVFPVPKRILCEDCKELEFQKGLNMYV